MQQLESVAPPQHVPGGDLARETSKARVSRPRGKEEARACAESSSCPVPFFIIFGRGTNGPQPFAVPPLRAHARSRAPDSADGAARRRQNLRPVQVPATCMFLWLGERHWTVELEPQFLLV